jgi:ABC-type nitrate/sulfonate/bicarbonate transport system ATPase subunit
VTGAIEIRGLRKTFPGDSGHRLTVFDDLSLSIRGGEFVCVVGPSGCGKSTILHTIAGIATEDAGKILIDGQDHLLARTGYVFQEPRLLNWRTATENIAFAARAAGLDARDTRIRVQRYLEMVGLSDFANAYPLALSGGMQQRVAIARALVIRPQVLLMDEPFSSLDELTARRMRSELLRLWEEERHTVVFVTHNALEAVYLADRIYVLSARPARILREVVVDVVRPRDFEDPMVLKLQREIIATLTE